MSIKIDIIEVSEEEESISSSEDETSEESLSEEDEFDEDEFEEDEFEDFDELEDAFYLSSGQPTQTTWSMMAPPSQPITIQPTPSISEQPITILPAQPVIQPSQPVSVSEQPINIPSLEPITIAPAQPKMVTPTTMSSQYTITLPNFGEIQFETIGRMLIMRYPSGSDLAQYAQYFQNIRGEYKEDLTGGPGWTFSKRQESRLRELLDRISSGQLPPPHLLSIPSREQITIDPNAVGSLPSQDVIERETQVFEGIQISPTVTSRAKKPRATRPKQSVLPSQVISEMQPIEITPGPFQTSAPIQIAPAPIQIAPAPIQIAPAPIQIAPAVTTVAEPIRTVPAYDPTERDPGESDAEYQRRIQLYTMLINQVFPGGQRIPSETADKLARMRNNVDIHGIQYNSEAMKILNMYLPLQQ